MLPTQTLLRPLPHLHRGQRAHFPFDHSCCAHRLFTEMAKQGAEGTSFCQWASALDFDWLGDVPIRSLDREVVGCESSSQSSIGTGQRYDGLCFPSTHRHTPSLPARLAATGSCLFA